MLSRGDSLNGNYELEGFFLSTPFLIPCIPRTDHKFFVDVGRGEKKTVAVK